MFSFPAVIFLLLAAIRIDVVSQHNWAVVTGLVRLVLTSQTSPDLHTLTHMQTVSFYYTYGLYV